MTLRSLLRLRGRSNRRRLKGLLQQVVGIARL